ncbi:unnamed protein product [Arabidopsis thaliana]|uniref:Uncharacterized protein n=2 Tax=Arabidopsis thaliana TaxID=3702 RepID=A0A654FUV9_ARATH|nr:uncharacterized protein AT4G32535 [Arabidopsis thaliana]ANM66286.1 hypothetical protein AT4G32535 [Arabidopsis thaliana]VYS64661.1 unnamed protein product [Arabidopsis thaliana]|eukprot:NP_001328193.1 hypothetical protein AT4G32535 [Arabidopsis thaliana]
MTVLSVYLSDSGPRMKERNRKAPQITYMFLLKYVERQKTLHYHYIQCLNPQSQSLHDPKDVALKYPNESSYSAMNSHCYSEQDMESTQFLKATN